MGDCIKQGKKTTGRYLILVIVIAAAALIIGLLYGNLGPSTMQQRLNNVDLADIQTVIGNAVTYTALEINNITSFASSQSVTQSGYRSVSVSEFNSTPPHNGIYPVLITSVLYEMANSSAANQIEQSVLYTAKQPVPRISGRLYNYTDVTPFTYSGKSIYIYSIASIAVLNSSYIPSVNQYPIYEYTSVFSYGNYVGFVSTSGYENMSQTYSVGIEKILFQKLIATTTA